MKSEHTMPTTTERKEGRLTPFRNRRGEITCYIRLYWAESLQTWVSIPGREN